MEITDYLRIARGRLWLLILIPLLAATAAIGYVLQSPPQYSATATLSTTAFVGGLSTQFTGTQAASQFAAAFTSSATGPAVLAAASRQTHIPVQELRSGLSVSQNGASSDMTLKFSSPHRLNVLPALNAVEQAALNNIFGLRASLAQSEVAQAKASYDRAVKDRDASKLRYGVKAPQTVYRAQLARLAFGALRAAQTAYQSARAQLTAAQAKNILFVSPVQSVGSKSVILGTVIPVVGAAIFLSVILVMILELLSRSRERVPVLHGSSTADTLPQPE